MNLKRLLKKEMMYPEIHFTSQEQLFEFVGNELGRAGYVTPTYKEKISEREKSFPTGLRTKTVDVAIPHTDPETVKRAFIMVMKLTEGIPFNQMGTFPEDAVIVYPKLVFVLGFDHGDIQLELLQALMTLFNNQLAMNKLIEATCAEQLLNILEQELVLIAK